MLAWRLAVAETPHSDASNTDRCATPRSTLWGRINSHSHSRVLESSVGYCHATLLHGTLASQHHAPRELLTYLLLHR
jgi:hypothetical protein